jgi:hypothetical protein
MMLALFYFSLCIAGMMLALFYFSLCIAGMMLALFLLLTLYCWHDAALFYFSLCIAGLACYPALRYRIWPFY